jgi:gas vesicle protein GvpO
MAPRQASHDRRAESRAKRRAAKNEPQPEIGEETAPSEAAEALWEAASAAIVGAAVGAAKALAQQREAQRGEDVPAESLDEPVDESEPEEPEPEPEAQAEPEPEPEPEPEGEPGRPGDAPKMVERAQQHLLELRGERAESVSTVARTAHGWRVGLEVVEVRRIPESTDVLATYELQLDADGELLNFDRTHRYYRSEADRR